MMVTNRYAHEKLITSNRLAVSFAIVLLIYILAVITKADKALKASDDIILRPEQVISHSMDD